MHAVGALVFAIVGLTASAQQPRAASPIKARLLAHLDAVKVIDCHEHLRLSPEYEGRTHNFYTILSYSYLQYDLVSAGAKPPSADQVNAGDLDALWDGWGRYLEYARATSYYRQLLLGFQKLHRYRHETFSKEGIAELSRSVAAKYSNRDDWDEKAMEASGIELMFLDKWWNNHDTTLRSPRYRLVFNVGDLVRAVAERPAPGAFVPPRGPYGLAEQRGKTIRTLADYLAFAEAEFEDFQRHGVVSVKNATAYWRSLDFENVPLDEAASLFARPSASLSAAEKKALQDFVFHWVIKEATKRGLPIQIHTGYLSGNGNTLANADPLKLTNLFLAYPDARFVLFHGGLPWTREVGLLAKMFPNVSLDLVWLPQLSRQIAIQTLDEMLDLVPYNKFFWGGDCHFIEETAGSLEVAKDVVAEVLANRVGRGLLSEDLAREIGGRIFRQNAVEYFKLLAPPTR